MTLHTLSTAAQQNPLVADWDVSPLIAGAGVTALNNTNTLTYQAPYPAAGSCVQIAVTATKKGSQESHTVYFALTTAGPANRFDAQEPCPGSLITVAIIGFEQAGGTSARSAQKFFVDMFDSRPLPVFKRPGSSDDPVYGPAWRWWGAIRIASYPQQIASPVGQFNVAADFAKLPTNQLAGFGEFRAGLERRLKSFRQPFLPVAGGSSERTTLGWIAYFGGLADLNALSEHIQVFSIPAAGTPQRQAFDNVFPTKTYPVLGAPEIRYVGLTGPDHPGFYWQYAAGFRLTTRYFDPDGTMLAAPALFSATFGQNELVTGGARRGVVGVFEGFYPLPLGPRGKNANLFYLFGRADIRLNRANLGTTPLVLSPALDSKNNAIRPDNPMVAIIALPSNRDLYSIGIGLDAVEVINAIRSAASQQKRPNISR